MKSTIYERTQAFNTQQKPCTIKTQIKLRNGFLREYRIRISWQGSEGNWTRWSRLRHGYVKRATMNSLPPSIDEISVDWYIPNKGA
jgi:hypothetical protein